MHASTTGSTTDQGKSSSKWTIFACVFSFLFGVSLIANVHPAGDGLWYWYATLFRGGSHLYADMHLNLQPLFILLTALAQRAFGSGWVASKSIALLQLLTFIFLLLAVLRQVRWKDWERAALMLATFGLMLTMPYFRLDDYHITTHIFVLGGVVGLVALHRAEGRAAAALMAALLGCICAASIANRLNDGAGLMLACGIALPFCARRHRVLLFGVAALCSVACLIFLIRSTGDTLSSWASESIFHASRIKGGTGNILSYPLRLPFRSIRRSHLFAYEGTAMVSTFFVLALLMPVSALVSGKDVRRRRGAILAVSFALLCTYPALYELCRSGLYNFTFTTAAIAPVYGLNVWVLYRLYQVATGATPTNWTWREALLLLPFLQLCSSAMTAGTGVPEAAPAIGLTLLLLPVSLPGGVPSGVPHRVLLTAVCFVAAVSYLPKYIEPYRWQHFQASKMFHNRTVYDHPALGPMLIEKNQLALFRSLCAHVRQGGSADELLSIPYPYPNYFCAVTPWHGYVQTWYDTSGADTVHRLMDELTAAPPKWIVYNRELDTIGAHEEVFFNYRRLPHRDLDDLIVRKIALGEWNVVGYKQLNKGDWFLVQTR